MAIVAVSHGAAATAMVTSAGPTGGWQGPVTMAVWAVGSVTGGVIVLLRGELATPAVVTATYSVGFAAVAAAGALLSLNVAGLAVLVFALGLPISSTVSAVFRGSRPHIDDARQVEVFAAYASLNFLGFSFGAATAGWAARRSGADRVGFLAAAVASLLALAVLPIVRPSRGPSGPLPR